jgi:hypothetical protein
VKGDGGGSETPLPEGGDGGGSIHPRPKNL